MEDTKESFIIYHNFINNFKKRCEKKNLEVGEIEKYDIPDIYNIINALEKDRLTYIYVIIVSYCYKYGYDEAVEWIIKEDLIDNGLRYDQFGGFIIPLLFNCFDEIKDISDSEIIQEKRTKIIKCIYDIVIEERKYDFVIYCCKFNYPNALKWIYEEKHINIHVSKELPFRTCCEEGSFETAKWIFETTKKEGKKLNINEYDQYAFNAACHGNYLKIAKWLWMISKTENMPINIRNNNDELIKGLYLIQTESNELKPIEIIKWLCSICSNYYRFELKGKHKNNRLDLYFYLNIDSVKIDLTYSALYYKFEYGHFFIIINDLSKNMKFREYVHKLNSGKLVEPEDMEKIIGKEENERMEKERLELIEKMERNEKQMILEKEIAIRNETY